MKKMNLNFLTLGFGLFLASNAGFAGQDFIKVNPEQLRQGLLERCQQAETCRADEINRYVDGVVSQIEAAQGYQALLAEGEVKGTIPEIIRKIQETGIKVVEVTIKSGKTVVRFTGEQLEKIYESPVVQGMVRAGEKTIEITVEGVEKTIDVTIDLTKKAGIYQIVSVTVKTAYNVVKDVVGHVAEGTWEVLEAFFTSRPVVLVVDGADYLVKKLHLGEIAEKVGEFAWETTTVFAEGTWNVVKFAYNGTMLVLGLPVEFVKWVFGRR